MADEVESTTRNKTVTKKAQSQLPPGSTLAERGLTPQQKQFKKQVETTVTDPGTQKDVLKAAGLPGVGLTSKPPAKTPPKPKPKPKRTLTPMTPSMKRYMDALRSAGIPEHRIEQYMSTQFSQGPGQGRRAERREKFLRRQAAEKYGTPP